VPDAPGGAGSERQAGAPAEAPRDLDSLVESPLCKAPRMQRHRYEKIDRGQRLRGEAAREEGCKREPGAVLESLHQTVARELVEAQGKRGVEEWRAGEAAPGDDARSRG